MPTGKYRVTLRRPGWPEVTEDVDLSPGASVNIQHTYQGTSVALKSDPAGATVYFAGTALGQTPLTVNLPVAQIELTSKIGSLTPITQRLVPDPSGNTVVEFKHTYGLLSVTCDRPDADVVIGGIDLGKPPIEGILPPSKQSVVVKVEGRPDQVRTADIQAGKRVVLEFTFGGAGPAETSASPPNNLRSKFRGPARWRHRRIRKEFRLIRRIWSFQAGQGQRLRRLLPQHLLSCDPETDLYAPA